MENWLMYVAIVVIVVYCPGPMTMFALANAVSYGKKTAIIGILGGTVAYIMHLCVVYASLSVVSHFSPSLTKTVRTIGALYFFWMAYRQWHSSSINAIPKHASNNKQLYEIATKGFLIAASNPKAILFFAALFPQFIHLDQTYNRQFLILSITYLLVQFISNLTYVFVGVSFFSWLNAKGLERLTPKVIALILVIVGILLII